MVDRYIQKYMAVEEVKGIIEQIGEIPLPAEREEQLRNLLRDIYRDLRGLKWNPWHVHLLAAEKLCRIGLAELGEEVEVPDD